MIVRLVQIGVIFISIALFVACAQPTPTPRVIFITATPPGGAAPTVSGSANAGATSDTTSTRPLPTLLATVTAPPSVTAQPTFTALPLTTPTAAPPPINTTAAATVPGQAQGSVYVTAIQTSPARPVRGQGVAFIVTFVNTTNAPQSFNWLVLIYRPDAKRSFGETSAQQITVPPGTSQFTTPNNWHISAAGACEPFFAQAAWQDSDKVRTTFTSTNGGVASVDFNVCPP